MLTYKQSGVDIDEGNRAVDLIKGKISSIPELEEYLLPADVTKYYPDRHCYGMSVTANKLS